MLSAVAARKARLEARSSPRSPPKSHIPAEDITQHHDKPSKRRSSHNLAKHSETKKRKVGTTDRKLAIDSLQSQKVVVPDDDERDSSSSSDGESSQRYPGPRRARSPSTLLSPPSDSESSDGLDGRRSELTAHTRLQTGRAFRNRPLWSTWRPVSNQTLFTLAEEDVQRLHLSSAASARLCLLRDGDRLMLVGVYLLTVVHGTVTLAGTKLSAQQTSHKVFAPWSSPIPVLECATSHHSPTFHSSYFNLSSHLRHAIIAADAAVIIQELRTGIEGLGRVCKIFDNVFSHPVSRPKDDLALSGVHYIESDHGHNMCAFMVLPSWERACEIALGPVPEPSRTVYLVQGAKKTGKSTFARMLLNALLSKYRKVAFLECDLGQSEFTPGGMVALNILDTPVFGPPFSHPSIPYRAHYIGSTSPKDSPGAYVEAIGALMQNYILDVRFSALDEFVGDDDRIVDTVPLVVNTMGWTKGLGADIASKVLDVVQPSEVFQIRSTGSDDDSTVYEASQHTAAGGAYKIHLLHSPQAIGNSLRFSPADHRTLALLSYFHAVFTFDVRPQDAVTSLYAATWNTSTTLCAQVPYEVSAMAAFDAIVLVGPGSEDVAPKELSRVLNGSLVGLVSYESGMVDLGSQPVEGTSLPYVQGAPPPSPAASTCCGLALVRSLDYTSPFPQFHMITPVPSKTLAHEAPRLLLKGPLEISVWGLLDFGESGMVEEDKNRQMPYMRWGKGNGTGAERRRIRRNLMRSGLH